MEIVMVMVFWLVLCGVAAGIAANKGRSGAGVFLLSVFLSPLVGLIVAATMAPSPGGQGKKKCSNCAEFVQPEAKVCRFCQHSFADEEAEATRLRAETVLRLQAVTARLQAEQAAKALKKSWLHRNLPQVAIGTVVVVMTCLYIVKLHHHTSTAIPALASRSNTTSTQVEDEDGITADAASSKVAQSVWKREVARAIKSHCYIEGMTKEQVTGALGKPLRTKTEIHDYWTYWVTATGQCFKYEGEKCVEHPMHEADIRFSISGHAENPMDSGDFLSLLSCK
jgi:hypothetical protein